MTALLRFAGVSRSFNSARGVTHALDDVSLTVEPGDFAAIVGPNGCGKSTLLHIAAGLDTSYTGDFQRTPSDAIGASMFQSPRLLPWLTARKNVEFVLKGGSRRTPDAAARADEMLARVSLTGFGDHFPSQLSGGMRQRVALARALIVDPDALLMDEPFAALDELTARRLRGELLGLYAAKPRTIVFVTHDIHEACYLADRVIVLSARPGRTVADVPVSASRPRAYEDPEVVQVAAVVLELIEADSSRKPPRSRAP